MSDLQTLVAQEVQKQLAAIAADQTTKKVLEFLKNRNSADAYVVETGGDSTSWYRVWSDGFIEQGGVQQIDVHSKITVTLPISFSNATYTLVGTGSESPNTASYDKFQITSRSEISFKVYTLNANTVFWMASGY